jgi:hypothetical protein
MRHTLNLTQEDGFNMSLTCYGPFSLHASLALVSSNARLTWVGHRRGLMASLQSV